MQILPIEKDIARELKIKVRQIMEWSTGKIKPQKGEKYIHLKKLGVYVCYKEKDK